MDGTIDVEKTKKKGESKTDRERKKDRQGERA